MKLGYSRSDIVENLLLSELALHIRAQYEQNRRMEEMMQETKKPGLPPPGSVSKKLTKSTDSPFLQKLMASAKRQ